MKDGLLGIRTYVIPVSIIEDTVAFLRSVGADGFEGFVLWGGQTTDKDCFRFSSSIVPAQQAMLTENGLLVTVDGQALFEVNRSLHERGLTLAAQVHSHPTEAYHSATDDAFPLVTILGGLSVVIPGFARDALGGIDRWAWYRLSKRGKWESASTTTSIVIE